MSNKVIEAVKVLMKEGVQLSDQCISIVFSHIEHLESKLNEPPAKTSSMGQVVTQSRIIQETSIYVMRYVSEHSSAELSGTLKKFYERLKEQDKIQKES